MQRLSYSMGGIRRRESGLLTRGIVMTENNICPIGWVDSLGKGWKTREEEIPIAPNRNIQILNIDGEGKVSTVLVSSRLAKSCCGFLWRENDISNEECIRLAKLQDGIVV